MNLSGQTALLTGATGGLGRAIAGELASKGASVILSSRKASELEQLAASLPGEGHRVIVSDLGNPGAAEQLAADAGSVGVLVANAGLPGTGKLETFSSEELQRALRVNLESPMLLARAYAPEMEENGAGHMVFVSSLSGKAPAPRSSVYSATKFGLRGFALGLRTDLARAGVGVSLISPGFIRDAGMFADSGLKAPSGMGTSTPQAVASAVVKAIERNKVEIVVAPLRLRALSHFALASPSTAVRVSGGKSGTKNASALAERQTDKR